MDNQYQRYIMTASGPSAQGQVAGITGFIDRHQGYVEEFDQFDDIDSHRFFARAAFRVPVGETPLDMAVLERTFGDIASRFGMIWSITDAASRPRVLLMASKADHCLRDLLYRHATGELKMEVVGVVSNHPDLASLADANGVPYYHLPVTPESRPEQEAELLSLIDRTGSDLVVLARYMQILSNELCEKLAGKAINIHHSFLPGFKGARPYFQAHDRGVKVIGATAHYVTPDLDEGPIIEQVVERVDHACRPVDLTEIGRNCECQALARAVKLHLQRRVFLNGNRTVVFT